MISTYAELLEAIKALPYINVVQYTLEYDEACADVLDLMNECDRSVCYYYDDAILWTIISPYGAIEFDYHQPGFGGTEQTAEQFLLKEAGLLNGG